MKIGLIGINKYAKFLNFACLLHIYAFQEYLKKQGYDPAVLDYKPAYYNGFNMRSPAPGAEQKYRDAVVSGAKSGTLDKLAELAVGYRSVVEERGRRFDKFSAFAAEYLNFTEEKYDSDLLEVRDPGFDCYMCVTDVIWQTIDKHTFDRGFLLGSKAFEGKAKVAYAASRGASKDFTSAQAEKFFSYLDGIDDISVRERDFEAYINENSALDVTTVMDPVMLHDKAFWEGVSVPPPETKYLLLYYVMERSTDTIAKAIEYAKLHDLTIVELSDRPLKFGKVDDPDVKHVARYDVGVDEWLGYVENAECVFTNSFHGCCFSVLFETPLFVGKRNGQKVPNFLATFELEDRQFEPDADVSTFSTEIDFQRVKDILAEEIVHSEEFIRNALQSAESKMADGPRGEHRDREAARRALQYPVRFHSGDLTDGISVAPRDGRIEPKRVASGALEFSRPGKRYRNDGTSRIPAGAFAADDYELEGWTLRCRIDNRWFWLLEDGSLGTSSDVASGDVQPKAHLQDGGIIPHLPVNHVSVVVLVASWRPAADDQPRDRGGSSRIAGALGRFTGRAKRSRSTRSQ